MVNLSILPLAQGDIQALVDYYDAISPKLTDLFLSELDRAFEAIVDYPEAYQKRYKEVRVIFLKRFSLGVYYKLYGKKAVVLGVLHTSQHPEIWKKRTQ